MIKKVKVFIGQPKSKMSDSMLKPIKDCAFEEVREILSKNIDEIELINPNTPNYCDAPEGTLSKPIWMLGQEISLLANADVIYFTSGWKNDRFCLAEENIAKLYDKFVLYEKDTTEPIDLNDDDEEL